MFRTFKAKFRDVSDKTRIPSYMLTHFQTHKEEEQPMYDTNGSNFSIDPLQEMKDEEIAIKKGKLSTVNLHANSPEKNRSKTNQQVKDFLKNESLGVLNISEIAMKPLSERTEIERQFYIMFLKLRISYFKNFSKKTLKLLVERMVSKMYRRGDYLSKFKEKQEEMIIIISGKVGEFPYMHPRDIMSHVLPETILLDHEIICPQAMLAPYHQKSTFRAIRHTICISLMKKDLQEVMQHLKHLEERNKQKFLMKC